MTRLIWDERYYESGVDQVVLYADSVGVPWNGVTSIEETSDENTDTTRYFEGTRYVIQQGTEDFSINLSALTYPDEFLPFDGQEDTLDKQQRKTFDLSYRVATADGYKIHLVYNAKAAPASKSHASQNEQSSAEDFSWDISTGRVMVPGARPTAHLILDSSQAIAEALVDVENKLYGSNTSSSGMPTPTELVAIFAQYYVLTITDHGDGSWTASGPASVIHMLDATTFQISSPSALYISDDTYSIHST